MAHIVQSEIGLTVDEDLGVHSLQFQDVDAEDFLQDHHPEAEHIRLLVELAVVADEFGRGIWNGDAPLQF